MERVWDFYKTKNIEELIQKAKAIKQASTLVFISFFVGRVALFGFMNPLMVAFLVGFIGSKRKIYIMAAAMAIGVVTRFEGLLVFKSLSALLLVLLAHMLITFMQIKPSKMTMRIVAGFSALFSGLIFAALFSGGPFFIFMAVGKCAFAVTLATLMKESILFIEDRHNVNAASNERTIGLMIVLGAAVAGAADIYIGVIALKYVLCALIVLIAARRGGAAAGALFGVSLSIVLAFAGSLNFPLMGVLSVGGIVAGLFRGGGKKAMAPGFLLGAFLSALYLDAHVMSTYFIFSSIAAVILFVLIPGNFSFSFDSGQLSLASEETDQIKTLMEQRLLRISASFKNMGYTLLSASEKRQGLNQQELSRIIDDTALKACSECPHKDNCWDKSYYEMHHSALKILENCEAGQDPYLDGYEGPCEYIGYFSNWISRQYEIYKLNLNWQNQMVEARQLMSQQIMGCSEIIDGLLYETKQRETLKSEFSEKISKGFAKKNIEVRNVIILENAHGKFSVSLERKSCRTKSVCFKEAARIVSSCIGRKMIPAKKACTESLSPHAKCSLQFIEEPKFRIRSGAAHAKKDGSAYSGDCHSVMEISGSQTILALSDGMGSGKRARAESEAAMGLLQDFLEAGFSRELALKLINFVLVLKDGSEQFSTMDICAIDMHTGLAQFVKFGAASTFIKRGESVSQITSESLPIGILTEIDAEICKRSIKGDDLIVMITDGVYDSGGEENYDFEKNWVAAALEELDSSDPQEIADYLIELAQERSEDVIKDDMTVLCARVHSKSA